jgi:hypothetical protein
VEGWLGLSGFSGRSSDCLGFEGDWSLALGKLLKQPDSSG